MMPSRKCVMAVLLMIEIGAVRVVNAVSGVEVLALALTLVERVKGGQDGETE